MSKKNYRLTREEREILKSKIKKNQRTIRQEVLETDSAIKPRTQAANIKFPAETVQEQEELYQDIASAQIKAWRSLLPGLIKKFSKIKDPRSPDKIKHTVTVLMLFGMFLFIFRKQSRRAMNSELTQPALIETLKKVIPELTTIPHADTLARFLEKTDPIEIEKLLVNLIRDLIRKKKFKKQLVHGYLNIAIDGTEKLFRDGLLNTIEWVDRQRREGQGWKTQQYVAVVEANIVFPNGLSIPLLSEYLYLDEDKMNDSDYTQDCELKAAARLIKRLKGYFPRLKIRLLLDSLYPCETILELLTDLKFQFLIKLPNKLKSVKSLLQKNKSTAQSIPGQPYYRERHQEFYWYNDIIYGNINIHTVGCIENWKEVNKETGDIEKQYSEHTWISSESLSIDNVHALCNLSARKRASIEDNMNTEKHRGYHYKHAFSYNWNAMRGFHYLMRLGHAINALSEFTKYLKKYIKKYGWSTILKLLFTIFANRWLTKKWIKIQLKKAPQLRLSLE